VFQSRMAKASLCSSSHPSSSRIMAISSLSLSLVGEDKQETHPTAGLDWNKDGKVDLARQGSILLSRMSEDDEGAVLFHATANQLESQIELDTGHLSLPHVSTEFVTVPSCRQVWGEEHKNEPCRMNVWGCLHWPAPIEFARGSLRAQQDLCCIIITPLESLLTKILSLLKEEMEGSTNLPSGKKGIPQLHFTEK
jgi:hypothetical protein